MPKTDQERRGRGLAEEHYRKGLRQEGRIDIKDARRLLTPPPIEPEGLEALSEEELRLARESGLLGEEVGK